MKNKHTPEKLEVFFDGMSHLIKEATPTGYNIARTHFGVEKDGIECEPGNARRLVACWNACDGIPTDDIEGSNLWADWLNEKSENATLRAENERLKLAHENTWQALSRMIAKYEDVHTPAFLAFDEDFLAGRVALSSTNPNPLYAAAPQMLAALQRCKKWFFQNEPLAVLPDGTGQEAHREITDVMFDAQIPA